jgi:filamentous hemagglutinin
MPWLRHFALFLVFVAALFRPAAAGASVSAPDASSQARVGAFEVVAGTLVGPMSAATCGLHEGIGAAYDENASGYRFAAGGATSVPGRVLSRINVSNSAWAHVLERHFAGTGSRFSIAQGELRDLLGSRQVVASPVVRKLESADGVLYLREVDVGRIIGFDKYAGADTSILSVISDRFGNLVTAFPGVLK